MNYEKFCIVTEGRTGSGMLNHTLQSHPAVISSDELFNRSNSKIMDLLAGEQKLIHVGDDPVKFIESYIYGDQPEWVGAVGFKIRYDQARDRDWSKLWIYLRRNVQIIHVKRRNLLDRYLSWRLSERDGIYEIYDETETYEPTPVYIDSRELARRFEESTKKSKEIDSYFKTSRFLDVYYENIIADVELELSRVLDFLHLPPASLYCPSVRQRTRSKVFFIENYSELKKHFSNTPYGEFFDE